MKITFELDDRLAPSIEQYLRGQARYENDEVTKTQKGVGGLLHFMLPESALDRDKAQRNPFLFADTGIPLLFRGSFEHGADRKRMVVQLAGGAQMMDEAGVFNIGKRNYLAAKKLLWKNGFMTRAEAVGGTVSRLLSAAGRGRDVRVSGRIREGGRHWRSTHRHVPPPSIAAAIFALAAKWMPPAEIEN